ncbi:MAG: hypothetical protein S4CHLAM102_02880 [Chlamydiia bacterium]|nr:hypothetical protein [Chlamydiia bacterium]
MKLKADPPHILGHRGAPWGGPTNTLESFQALFNQNIYKVEFDVQLTKDFIPVVIHDRVLDSSAFINEKGFLPPNYRVKDHTLQELKALKFVGYPQLSIPTLEELFTFFKAQKATEPLLLNIEFKRKPEEEDLSLPHGIHAQKVHALVCQFHFEDNVLYTSFDERIIEHFATLAPSIPRGIITSKSLDQAIQAAQRTHSVVIVARSELYNHVGAVQKVHNAGLAALTWDVDTTTHLDSLQAAGIDGVISDHPKRLLDHLARY